MRDKRIVSWFSCGAASAVATKLAIKQFDEIVIYYCEVAEEHPDNKRFINECAEWFGMPIKILGNDKYSRSAKEVFRKTKYLVGPKGSRCTGELKKYLRWENSIPNDVHILGYTKEEIHRISRLKSSEPLLEIRPLLVEEGLTKQDCMAILKAEGIQLPAMYKLGYKNNNCICCVKGGLGYWNKIRVDFPKVFSEMCEIERELNRTICKIETRENGIRKQNRIFLDELPPEIGNYSAESDVECGILCENIRENL